MSYEREAFGQQNTFRNATEADMYGGGTTVANPHSNAGISSGPGGTPFEELESNRFISADPKSLPPQILEFPTNVASGDAAQGNHGHYIMFYINEQDRAQLSMSERAGTGGSVADDPKRKYNVAGFIKKYKEQKQEYQDQTGAFLESQGINLDAPTPESINRVVQGPDIETLNVIDNGGRTKGSTIRLTRAPTHRLRTAIAMYMPASVQVTYGAQYTDTPIGAVTEQALNAYNRLVNEGGEAAVEGLQGIGGEVANSLQQFMLGAIGVLPGLQGTKEAFEAKTANVIADRLELAFKGVNKRNFQYTFKMIPKNRKETEIIRRIVFAFKSNMLPEFVGGDRGGRKFLVPNTFDIAYMYTGSQNLHLHNISTCVLENMSVSYGGDRYKTFSPDPNSEGAQPVETQITLNFKEMELITRERVFEGY